MRRGPCNDHGDGRDHGRPCNEKRRDGNSSRMVVLSGLKSRKGRGHGPCKGAATDDGDDAVEVAGGLLEPRLLLVDEDDEKVLEGDRRRSEDGEEGHPPEQLPDGVGLTDPRGEGVGDLARHGSQSLPPFLRQVDPSRGASQWDGRGDEDLPAPQQGAPCFLLALVVPIQRVQPGSKAHPEVVDGAEDGADEQDEADPAELHHIGDGSSHLERAPAPMARTHFVGQDDGELVAALCVQLIHPRHIPVRFEVHRLLMDTRNPVLGSCGVRSSIAVHMLARPVVMVRRPQENASANDGSAAVVVLGVLPEPVELDVVGAAAVEDGGDGDAGEGGVRVDPQDGSMLGGGGAPGTEEGVLAVPETRVEPSLTLLGDDGANAHHPLQVHLEHGGSPFSPGRAEPDEGMPPLDDDGSRPVLPVHQRQRGCLRHAGEVNLQQPTR
mmetsp:Transcript_36736/g.114677  ORF Transcript_36736/g.114677 Transcript_36736/m.114677 type:complete len:438 (-) Transcript_36736:1013-2326(-)